MSILLEELHSRLPSSLSPDLWCIVEGLLNRCFPSIAATLRHERGREGSNTRGGSIAEKAGSFNEFGEEQLKADVVSDEILNDFCSENENIRGIASEENTTLREVSPGGNFVLCWDPLDGSSIIGTNFSVGTIIGIWQLDNTLPWKGSDTLIGAKARTHQVASLIAVYGPRTTALVALPVGPSSAPLTFHMSLVHPSSCSLSAACHVLLPSPQDLSVPSWHIFPTASLKLFAPANLRATESAQWYRHLVIDHYVAKRYTLRYTGGLVPDTYQLIAKGGGIFVNPVTGESPAKLRLLYETAPIALIMEGAGGKALNTQGWCSILDEEVSSMDQRTGLVCGAVHEVDKAQQVYETYK